MTVRPFLDTNILLYATLEDRSPHHVQRIGKAESILMDGGAVSVQVFHEFADVARRKFKERWPKIVELLSTIEELCGPPLPITVQVHRRALSLVAQHGFRIYDAAIIATAMEAGCDALYTEDLHHGQAIDALRIENPFRNL